MISIKKLQDAEDACASFAKRLSRQKSWEARHGLEASVKLDKLRQAMFDLTKKYLCQVAETPQRCRYPWSQLRSAGYAVLIKCQPTKKKQAAIITAAKLYFAARDIPAKFTTRQQVDGILIKRVI